MCLFFFLNADLLTLMNMKSPSLVNLLQHTTLPQIYRHSSYFLVLSGLNSENPSTLYLTHKWHQITWLTLIVQITLSLYGRNRLEGVQPVSTAISLLCLVDYSHPRRSVTTDSKLKDSYNCSHPNTVQLIRHHPL